MTDKELIDQKNEIVAAKLRIKEINSTKEACTFLGVSPVTLWRERRAGRISYHRISSKIVYTRQNLESYLEMNKREAFGVKK